MTVVDAVLAGPDPVVAAPIVVLPLVPVVPTVPTPVESAREAAPSSEHAEAAIQPTQATMKMDDEDRRGIMVRAVMVSGPYANRAPT